MAAGHWVGYLVLLNASIMLFTVNMYIKEKTSYEKKEGWDKYKQKSYVFFFKIFPIDEWNTRLYSLLITAFIYFELRNMNLIQSVDFV